MLRQQTCNCPPVQECPSSVIISFDGTSFQVTAEGPLNGGKTWRYKVEKLSGRDLSHFDVQFCTSATVVQWQIFAYDPVQNQCTVLLASGTGPSRYFDILPRGDPASVCFANIPAIKFDNLSDFEDITKNFYFQFTLSQCYQTACICTGTKAGPKDGCGCVLGPSPDCVPCPPGRGFKMSGMVNIKI